jgi:energy-coupling factor transporter ATP-binding protein EcfA2
MTTKSLESIHIHQFRGLRDLELKNLGHINLIVGINNSGKTSVLEALNIYCHPLDIKIWLNTARQRDQEVLGERMPSTDALQWLFPHAFGCDKDEPQSGSIIISSEGSFPVKSMVAVYEQIEGVWVSNRSDDVVVIRDGQILRNEAVPGFRKGLNFKIDLLTDQPDQLSLLENSTSLSTSFQLWEGDFSPATVNLKNRPSLQTTTVTPSSHRSEIDQIRLLSEARFQNFKSDVLNLLQQLDKNISDIEILLSPGLVGSRFSIYIQHNKLGLAPISTFGDGVRRLLHIALKLASVRGGVLLIDELESAIHTEALQNSFSWISRWCREMDVQLFATTHSLEAVDALLEATDSSSDLVLYRLEPKEMHTRVVRHDWSRLKLLREELGQEVRW